MALLLFLPKPHAQQSQMYEVHRHVPGLTGLRTLVVTVICTVMAPVETLPAHVTEMSNRDQLLLQPFHLFVNCPSLDWTGHTVPPIQANVGAAAWFCLCEIDG